MTKARVNADNASADIQGVTAGTGLSGGGTSGTVTLTNDMATTIDAKGDLVVGTGADTYSRLATGNAGETLVADSSTSTGLRYNPQNALANPVINGGMDIWQRGTSIAITGSTTGYSADRWQAGGGSNAITVSRQTTSDTTNLPNIQYSARVQRNSGQTATTNVAYVQSLETVNTIPFAGKAVTLSFYAKKGANYSDATSALTAYIVTGTGTDQNRLSGAYTGDNASISSGVTLTTSWQRFVVTGTIPATATEMAIYLTYTPTGTAGANDWFEVTGVQIDLGTYTASTAPTFRRAGGTLAGELAAAQRYYQRFSGSTVGVGFANSTSVAQFVLNHKSPLRNGTVTLGQSGMGVWDVTSFYSGGTWAIAANNNDSAGIGFTRVTYTHGSASLTQYRPYLLQNTDANSWLEVSAEL